jgi:hypothetical protein
MMFANAEETDDDNVTSWAVIVSVNFLAVRITVLILAISLQEAVRSIIQTQFFQFIYSLFTVLVKI